MSKQMSAATTLTASIKNENRKANTAQSAILNVTYIIIGKYVKQKQNKHYYENANNIT